MIIADLYIRVSTDEQADKGYSQRDQEERLRKHCFTHNITIGEVIIEDHSAKTFNRPKWIDYLKYLKKRSTKTKLLLFTKWDRFSRNTSDAYQMISQLHKLGVSAQAIEQPLDMSIPENKLLLAIYLSTPEVENDRRALNVFYGMRRAKKEGRMMGTAPYGYLNRSMEDGKKYVAVKEPEASNMIWAFKEVAKGSLPSEHIRIQMIERGGRQITRNSFIEALRNPVYCGRIYIRGHKQEDEYYIKGKHEALISEALFYKVQQVMDSRKKVERPGGRVLSNERYPLRGLLSCPKCGNNLTASGSKGKAKIYHYYHCNWKCGFRVSTELLNEAFEKELLKYEFNPGIKEILKTLLLNNYKAFTGGIDDTKKVIVQEIDTLNGKITKARDLFLSDKIDEEDYREVKKGCKEQIEQLEDKISFVTTESKQLNIPAKLDKALDAIANISKLYVQGDLETKRKIACSIYPEKMVFDGSVFQTPKINPIANYIFMINKELGKKKRPTEKF
jgi:site-specific DNA recombinase